MAKEKDFHEVPLSKGALLRYGARKEQAGLLLPIDRGDKAGLAGWL